MNAVNEKPFAGRDGVFGNAAQSEELRLILEREVDGVTVHSEGPYGAIGKLVARVLSIFNSCGVEYVEEDLDYGCRIYFRRYFEDESEHVFGKVVIRAKQTGRAEAQVVWLKRLPGWVSQEFFV